MTLWFLAFIKRRVLAELSREVLEAFNNRLFSDGIAVDANVDYLFPVRELPLPQQQKRLLCPPAWFDKEKPLRPSALKYSNQREKHAGGKVLIFY